MSTGTRSWSGRSKGTPLGYRIFIATIRTFGLRAAYSLLAVVVPWYVLTARESNAALRTYFERLRAHFPGIQGLGLARSYMAFGRNLIDKAAVQGGLGHRFRWSEHGKQHIETMMAARQGGILLGAHMGNWDLAGHALQGIPGAISVVLLSAEDERIHQVMEQSRITPPFDTIPLRNDLSHVFRIDTALREGRVLCMHGDRRMPGSRVRRLPFLGLEADFPVGPFALAASRGLPVCIAFVVRSGPLRYTFTSTPAYAPGTPAEDLMQHYVDELERTVRRFPLQWFNFYDFWYDASSDVQR